MEFMARKESKNMICILCLRKDISKVAHTRYGFPYTAKTGSISEHISDMNGIFILLIIERNYFHVITN